MVVGEPSLMGGEFGDEDERLITRLENNQYEPNPNEEESVEGGNSQHNPGTSGPPTSFQNSPVPSSHWPQDKKPPTGAPGDIPPEVKTE